MTREIHKRFQTIRLLGIDYSLRAITLANAMNQDFPKLTYEHVDITKYDCLAKFDVAILMEVFEHIPLNETHEFLKGIHNILKKGGVLLLTVPHSNKPVEYKHFQHFTIDDIKENLSSHFNVVEVLPFEKKGLIRMIFNSLLCNRFFVLNHPRLLNILYNFHQKFLFKCIGEQECQRIFVKAIAK